MLGVGILACFFGITTAWVVTRYQFPGLLLFEWVLLLPAAIPAYIVAYTYTDFFEYAGPVQSQLRSLGPQRPQSYSSFGRWDLNGRRAHLLGQLEVQLFRSQYF